MRFFRATPRPRLDVAHSYDLSVYDAVTTNKSTLQNFNANDVFTFFKIPKLKTGDGLIIEVDGYLKNSSGTINLNYVIDQGNVNSPVISFIEPVTIGSSAVNFIYFKFKAEIFPTALKDKKSHGFGNGNHLYCATVNRSALGNATVLSLSVSNHSQNTCTIKENSFMRFGINNPNVTHTATLLKTTLVTLRDVG